MAKEAARVALRDAFGRIELEQGVPIAQASTHIMEKFGVNCERDTMHRGVDVVLNSVSRSPRPENRNH